VCFASNENSFSVCAYSSQAPLRPDIFSLGTARDGLMTEYRQRKFFSVKGYYLFYLSKTLGDLPSLGLIA
jgi:hypothetical protein